MMFNYSEIEIPKIEQEIFKIETAIWEKRNLFKSSTFEIGYLGASLFYKYLSMIYENEDYAKKADNFFEKGIKALNVGQFKKLFKTDSIDNHIAQLGRFLEFAKSNCLFNWDTSEVIESFDQILADLMQSKIERGDFDIHSGALASGYFFLSRSNQLKKSERSLALLVKGIEKMALKDINGNYYWRQPTLYNRAYLGISHGSALIISFLCNVYDRGIEKEICVSIMTKAAAFLLNYRSNFGKGIFPNYVEDKELGPKQFSLCYGDIGIGYALLRMGKILVFDKIEELAYEILNDCMTRNKEDNLTLDASIIYGAAGLAATFEKLNLLTNRDDFLEASEYWYSKIPEYSIDSNQFASYKSRISRADNSIWDLSFGWGLCGIGVSLMKYLKPELPSLSPLMLIA